MFNCVTLRVGVNVVRCYSQSDDVADDSIDAAAAADDDIDNDSTHMHLHGT